jgi:hypothetical protein
MPEQFTIFNNQNRNPNAQYNSSVYTIPIDETDTKVKFTLVGIDLVSEVNTTVFHWSIDRLDGAIWRPMVFGSTRGRGGVPAPKPPGILATNIDNLKGVQLRGTVWFESLNDQRKRWGVDGETW